MGSLSGSKSQKTRAYVAVLVMGLTMLVLAGCAKTAVVPPPVPFEQTPTPASNVEPQQDSTPLPAPTMPAGQPLAARVGEQAISLAEYQKQVAEWETAFVSQNVNLSEQEKQEMLTQGRRQVLDVMIEQMLIEQAAASEGIVIS